VERFEGKRGLVFGVANRRSIAWAIAKQLADGGARLAFTFQGDRIEKNVRELAETVEAPLVTACDVRSDENLERVFDEAAEAFGGELDLLVHSVAYAAAEDLEGRFTDTPLLAGRVRAPGGAADGGGRRRLDPDHDLPRR
jgi:enoyl-[acyl-carrier protein] reductase I